jgi:hypothetical protein
LRSVRPQRLIRISPRPPPSPPQPQTRPYPAQNKPNIERRRQHGVAASQACCLLTCVSPSHKIQDATLTLFLGACEKKFNLTDDTPAPTSRSPRPRAAVATWCWRECGQRVGSIRVVSQSYVVTFNSPSPDVFFRLVRGLAPVFPIAHASNLAPGSNTVRDSKNFQILLGVYFC